MTEEQGFVLYQSATPPHDETYIIEDSVDLDALNATLTDSEKLSYTDLDTYTYFLIRVGYCTEIYEFSSATYTAPTLTVTLDHYRIPDVACPAVITEPYMVFKAAKAL